MDLVKLIEPYSEGGLRTIEAQIKWLLSKNIPRSFIDQAILMVYEEMDRGKTFENGHELDQYLLSIAKQLYETELSESVKKLETFFNDLVKTHQAKAVELAMARLHGSWLGRWWKLIASFACGAAVGAWVPVLLRWLIWR